MRSIDELWSPITDVDLTLKNVDFKKSRNWAENQGSLKALRGPFWEAKNRVFKNWAENQSSYYYMRPS